MDNSSSIRIGPIQAAHNAIALFFHALDAKDSALLETLFVDDAKLEIVVSGKTYNSKEEIGLEFIPAVHAMLTEKFGSNCKIVHLESNIVLGLAGSFLTNESYWSGYVDGKVIAYGKHEDLLRYDASSDTCQFFSRKVTHVWSS